MSNQQPMLTYPNNTKRLLVTRMQKHVAADQLIQGTGWEMGKGCFIGCAVHEYSHQKFSEQYGWPEWMAAWADTVFEGLLNADAMLFATELPKRVPEGVDLKNLHHALSVKRLNWLLKNISDLPSDVVSSIETVRDYASNFDSITDEQWDAAGDAAGAAARTAAGDAHYKRERDWMFELLQEQSA